MLDQFDNHLLILCEAVQKSAHCLATILGNIAGKHERKFGICAPFYGYGWSHSESSVYQ